MKRNRSALVLAAATLALLGAAALAGCSDDDDPYGPGPGPTGFDSGSMNAPANYVHTFATASTVSYHCTFHRSMGMTGTVTVVNGAADSAVVTASGMVFTPVAVSIKPGGYVRWAVTGGTHTVTQD